MSHTEQMREARDLGRSFYEMSCQAWGVTPQWEKLNQSERDEQRRAAKAFAALTAPAAEVPEAMGDEPALPETIYGLFCEVPGSISEGDEGYQEFLDEAGYTADQLRTYAKQYAQWQSTRLRAELSKRQERLHETEALAGQYLIERDDARAELARLRGGVPEPVWIVNDLGELGVKVGERFFFLYKGDNIEYEDTKHNDGSPMRYRIVGKREFGETCWPLSWVVAGRSEDRYTVNLTYIPGLSWGKPEDGEWRDLPSAPLTAAPQAPAAALDAGVVQNAKRYEWLCGALGETQLPTLIERITSGYVADYKPSIDAAIDAAMSAQAGKGGA